MDFEVQRCTRRCATTDREFRPSEPFYSVLRAEGSEILRHDYCMEAWKGPPDNVLGWWKSQMPDPHAHRVHWAPNDVIVHYFQELAEREEHADMRFLLTLLMIRRRLLRLEETERADGQETMVLYCPRNEQEYRVVVTDPTPERAAAIQDELSRLLFARPG